MVTENTNTKNKRVCACGQCGEIIDKKDRWGHEHWFKNGHNRKGKSKYNRKEIVVCRCGCGGTFIRYDSKLRERKYIRGHHSRGKESYPNLVRRGDKHHNWKGGRILDKNGYIRIHKPDHHHSTTQGYVREHRLVYEEYHKCCLLPWIIIHHKDKNKLNNSIENLEPMTTIQHVNIHRIKIDISNRKCINCNRYNNEVKKWVTALHGVFCCNKCYDMFRGHKRRKKKFNVLVVLSP